VIGDPASRWLCRLIKVQIVGTMIYVIYVIYLIVTIVSPVDARSNKKRLIA
jgi:hypothetical protein